MLKTNLATRPFQDDRALRVAGVAVAVLLAVFTVYNAVTAVRLSLTQSRLGSHAAATEREAARLRADAARVRTRIDPTEVASVAGAAREANALIDQRTFSWTGLFAELEQTLPPDVRVRAVQPRIDKGEFRVVISAVARRVEDLETFIENLERTGAFTGVSPLEETSGDGGTIDAVLDGAYRPRAVGAPR
ncbi:MAG: PilN domain-containing protein [Vicinamibacterales bacterium]